MHNPLLADIMPILQRSAAGISEYAIHQALTEHEYFKQMDNNPQLSLFKKHFMVMNALYQLKQQFWQDEKLVLNVSPLNIQLFKLSNSHKKNDALVEHDVLSEYYLDFSNYENTNKEEVDNLLDTFWQRFISTDKRINALTELGLNDKATPEQIEYRYRKLAAQHHPDRGGQKEAFILIRDAYETLK